MKDKIKIIKDNLQAIIFFVGIIFWAFSFYAQGKANTEAIVQLSTDLEQIDLKVDDIILKQEKLETILDFIR